MVTKKKLLSIGKVLVENINYLSKTGVLSNEESNKLSDCYLRSLYQSDAEMFEKVAREILQPKTELSSVAKETLSLILTQN